MADIDPAQAKSETAKREPPSAPSSPEATDGHSKATAGQGGKSETALREEQILQFWKTDATFEKSLQKEAPQGEFVFFDGPPFATGLPHTGSLLSSIIKDVIPRYKTMRGFRVPRRFGWDCHGLPIESLIEKRLQLKTKKDIERVGIATFNEAARSSVLEFEKEWEQYVDRVGRWVDFRNSYKTMDNSYIEAVWGALKSLHEKGLLYEGRKVLMYCPHCETPLAKAEIAMDNTYKEITEEAVTVKFKVKNPDQLGLTGDVYLLAWTTTPWTLPGNVALAINDEIVYAKVQNSKIKDKNDSSKIENGETLIVAKERLESIFGNEGLEIIGEIKGSELMGVGYEPLYDVPAVQTDKSHKVYAADFVNTEEGTGIVHTAVMYGEDDFLLGQKEGLPMAQLLDAAAHFNEAAPEFIRGEYIKKAEKAIKADLESRGLLFDKKNHTHSYPHCYRCGTPLIYNAVASWFINIQKVKDKLLSENEKINWVPEHLKHGRFKNIVENAPDWTISRNRFWASPLPIWKEKSGDRLLVVGSLSELKKKVKRSGNRYFAMRHGESVLNVKNILDSKGAAGNGLTDAGIAAVTASAQQLKNAGIDLIFVSPLERTRETAAIVQKELRLPDSAVAVDERLAEVGLGIYSGRTQHEWSKFYGSLQERLDEGPQGGESFTQVRRRVGEFLSELERTYAGKNILIVSHGNPIWSMTMIAAGVPREELLAQGEQLPEKAEVRELPFASMPYNQNYEIDLHRPYTDYLTLIDEDGREYERIPEVVDCWVESGAMPFAQSHAMGVPITEPPIADFIAEYIAQTRTWFYYTHAMGVALFGRQAFRNVVSTGTILAADGSKMSKSKGNYTDPLNVMEQYGADALRYHLMQSVVMQSEDLKFRDEDVREAHNRIIGILVNSYKFFELYKNEYDGAAGAALSRNPLDRWILARLAQLRAEMTDALDVYDLPRATRPIRAFVDDYSTWYVRRSRGRVKGGDAEDKQFSLATQHHVLLALSKLVAPIMPFVAEYLYRSLGGAGSVHLCDWPDRGAGGEAEGTLITEMAKARTLVSQALLARERAGLKLRQPLSKLTVRELPHIDGIDAVIKEELNVKEIETDANLAEDLYLDTEVTPELMQEGLAREIVRMVQDLRKKEGYTIQDKPALTAHTNEAGRQFLNVYADAIAAQTGVLSISIDVETADGDSEGPLPFPLRLTLRR